MREELLSLVTGCAREVGELQELELPSDLTPHTQLFGQQGLFDSVGLVGLVVAVEEAIEDQYGLSVTLADQRAMSQERSPFRTVGSLSEYAVKLIESSR